MNIKYSSRKKFLLLLITILCGIGCFFFFFHKNFSDERNLTHKTDFIVGIATGYAPFVSLSAEGNYEGFDIDFAHELAQKMGKNLVLSDLGSMSTLFIALEQGMIDAIIWGVSITNERLAQVAMINYYGDTITHDALVFWGDIPKGVNGLADIEKESSNEKRTISVEPHSSQEKVIDQHPLIIKNLTDKVDDALLAIRYGKSAAALVEPAIAKKFQKKYPEKINIIPIILPRDLQNHGVGVVVKKNNTELITQIELAVAQLKNSKYIENIAQKWGIE